MGFPVFDDLLEGLILIGYIGTTTRRNIHEFLAIHF